MAKDNKDIKNTVINKIMSLLYLLTSFDKFANI